MVCLRPQSQLVLQPGQFDSLVGQFLRQQFDKLLLVTPEFAVATLHKPGQRLPVFATRGQDAIELLGLSICQCLFDEGTKFCVDARPGTGPLFQPFADREAINANEVAGRLDVIGPPAVQASVWLAGQRQ
jgi:hypothetical protein